MAVSSLYGPREDSCGLGKQLGTEAGVYKYAFLLDIL